MTGHDHHRITDESTWWPWENVPLALVAGCFVLVMLAVVYAVAAARLGRVWPAYRIGFFVLGSIALGVAAVLSTDGAVGIIGHVVAMMVAPAFLVLARPLRLLLRTGPPAARRSAAGFARLWSDRVARRRFGNGRVAVEYMLSMYVLLLTPVISVVGHSAVPHLAVHAYMVLCGIGFYSLVLGMPIRGRAAPIRARFRLACSAIPATAVLGVLLLAGIGWGDVDELGAVAFAAAGTAAALFGALLVAAQAWFDTPPRPVFLAAQLSSQ